MEYFYRSYARFMQESNVDEHLNEETMKEIPTVYTIHGINGFKGPVFEGCLVIIKCSVK